MRSKNFFFILILINPFYSCTSTQVVKQSPIPKIEVKASFFEVDFLKQFYFVGTDNSLIKKDIIGKTLFVYEDNRTGRISQLDVSKSLQVLVFYEDFQLVKILDRTLNEILVISLIDLGFNKVKCIAAARDFGIWIFDQDEQQLVKIDQQQKIISKSDKLTQIFDQQINPVGLLEYENKLFLLNKTRDAFFIFDNFGEYLGLLELGEPALSYGGNGGPLCFLGASGTMNLVDLNYKEPQKSKILKVNAVDVNEVFDAKIHKNYELYLSKDHLLLKKREF